MLISGQKQRRLKEMNPPKEYNTLELLNTQVDAVHVIYHNIFRLLKPVRRKYRISVNNLVVLNGCYLFHKYKGSLFSVYAIHKFIGYYNKNKLIWHVEDLINKGCLVKSDAVKGIQYYRMTEKGNTMMIEFNESYQSILYKWYNDNNVNP